MALIDLTADKPFDVVCFGYNSVDLLCRVPHFPRQGRKLVMSEFSQQGGGQSATAAAALARSGFRARYLGKFGGGAMGRFARESLAAEGVDVSGALVDEAVSNQIAVIFVEDGTGERTITYTRVPGLEVRPEEVDRDAVQSGRVLLVDAHQLPATTRAAAWAREAGIPVVVDAERASPGVEALLEHCDFILCDQRFPEDLTGETDPKRALAALSRYGRLVAMTLGAEGSLAYADGRYIRTPAYQVECVDTTGAGDVFHAGFVAGLLLGMDAPGALRYANAAAALKCRALGGRAGIPTRSEVLDLIALRDGAV